jgi:hypothetical protein
LPPILVSGAGWSRSTRLRDVIAAVLNMDASAFDSIANIPAVRFEHLVRVVNSQVVLYPFFMQLVCSFWSIIMVTLPLMMDQMDTESCVFAEREMLEQCGKQLRQAIPTKTSQHVQKSKILVLIDATPHGQFPDDGSDEG